MHWNLINHNYNAQDYYDILYEEGHIKNNSNSNKMQQTHYAYDDIEVKAYHDPWEDYYYQQQQQQQQQLETTSGNNNWQQTVDNEVENIENVTNSNLHILTTDRNNDQQEINSCEIVHNQTYVDVDSDENYSNKIIVHNSSIIDITTKDILIEEQEKEVTVEEVNNVHRHVELEHVAKLKQVVANEHYIETEVYHCPEATTTNIDDETIERDINIDTYIVTNHRTPQFIADNGAGHEQQLYSSSSTDNVVEESGLAGALSQLRLGEPRSPEQEAYEQSMRRQAWEQGQVDYTGKDSFDNILKRITETLDNKPTKASQDAAESTTGSSS